MSCSGSKWFNPAQVFAQFTTSSEKDVRNSSKKLIHEDDNGEKHFQPTTNRREIQVTESAEVSLPPDKAKVSIVCACSKESVEDVKTSVTRRLDYVIHTLKSHHIKDDSYQINRILSRTESTYTYKVEVVVEFTDFLKCEEVCNLLVEKLDETVRVSTPVFYHSPSKLEALRCQACVSAVKNAKNKALQVVQMFNQILGSPITIREDRFEEFTGQPQEHLQDDDSNSERHSFSGRIAQATVTVCVKVFVVFEIKEKMKVHKGKK